MKEQEQEIREYLESYGKVEIVILNPNYCIIKITEGFENKTKAVYSILEEINVFLESRYPRIGKLKTGKNIFECTLKK